MQGAPLNSIPEGNSREDKRSVDANRRESPGRRSMLMARARPDGLPRPLNMYRRVLSLRLSSFRLSIFTFRRKQRQRLLRALAFVCRSARDTSRSKRGGDESANHRIRLRAVSIRRRLEFARFVSERVCWTFVDESNWRNGRRVWHRGDQGIDARQL